MHNDRCGIITGCDHILEWTLPWWWFHYKQHNTFPVAFIDFGMSEKAKAWCRERGELISLCCNELSVAPKEQVDPQLAKSWEFFYGKTLWPHRKSWFKKIFAAEASPFSRTVWIDIDCEIAAELSPLFSLCDNPAGFSIAKESDRAHQEYLEHGLLLPNEACYNSGVFSFTASSPVLKLWLEMSGHATNQFVSDQTLLSRIIFTHSFAVTEMSPLYNWHMKLGENAEALIKHWAGSWGKEQIGSKMDLLHKMAQFFHLEHFDL